MLRFNCWKENYTWENSRSVKDLYRKRCRGEEIRLTAHIQAASLLKEVYKSGETILDVGCGSGYLFHSLNEICQNIDYYGIDQSPSLIEIGQQELPRFGLSQDRLINCRIEDVDGEVDHVICINVLSNIDNYHKPLDRILKIARKSVILRESIKQISEYNWFLDKYLDPEISLSVYVNHYGEAELLEFIRSRGFSAKTITDIRTGGKPEMVINYPHHWTFVVAKREGSISL